MCQLCIVLSPSEDTEMGRSAGAGQDLQPFELWERGPPRLGVGLGLALAGQLDKAGPYPRKGPVPTNFCTTHLYSAATWSWEEKLIYSLLWLRFCRVLLFLIVYMRRSECSCISDSPRHPRFITVTYKQPGASWLGDLFTVTTNSASSTWEVRAHTQQPATSGTLLDWGSGTA